MTATTLYRVRVLAPMEGDWSETRTAITALSGSEPDYDGHTCGMMDLVFFRPTLAAAFALHAAVSALPHVSATVKESRA